MSRFDSHHVQLVLLLSTGSGRALDPTQPPTQWISESLSPMIKWPGRVADHSQPCRAERKN
jgi:hypothetical protein